MSNNNKRYYKTNKKRNYNKAVETNSIETSSTAPTAEFNSYITSQSLSYSYFGIDLFSLYSHEQLVGMVRNPMVYNKELREISEMLYNTSGTVTNTIDYITAMPTLDKVIITKGKNKNKKIINKELVISTLEKIKDREFIRDALWSAMIDGVAFYYFETISRPNYNEKYLNDFDVNSIFEVNNADTNVSIISLPVDYTKIVWRRNNHYQIAFNLDYFNQSGSTESIERRLKKFPKEIREGYLERYKNGKFTNGNWLVLNHQNTIVHKIRSKMSEPFGRPIVLAAIKDILYKDYFTSTKRGVLDEINNKVVYQTFPEGEKKGTSALTQLQQENQHKKVKDAILTKQNKSSTTVISVAAGTKLDVLDTNNATIFDSKNEENLSNDIALDMGIASALLNGVGSGSYAAQTQNLELITGQIFQWVEQISNELNKCIAANIIKDDKNMAKVTYLPITCANKSKTIECMRSLYLEGCGSLTAWAAACGLTEEVFYTLLDQEIDNGVYEKYKPHQTSFTLSNKDSSEKGGRPKTDNPTENTIKSQSNNGNSMPSPSDNK